MSAQPEIALGCLPDDFRVERFKRTDGDPMPVLLTGPENAAQFVYRLYERGEGNLAYVGIGARWLERVNHHAFTKAWWPQINFVTAHGVPTRERAAALEAVLIARYRPLFNIALPTVETYAAALDGLIQQGIDDHLAERRAIEAA